MQRSLIALAAALSLSWPGLALADSKTLDVNDFTGLDIASGIHAEVASGATFSVVAESPNAADLEELRYSVSGGVLHASYDFDIFSIFRPSGRSLTLHITLPRLERIDISSGANLVATSPASDTIDLDVSSGAHAAITGARAATYSIDVSSGGSARIEGTCRSLATDVSSGASLDAHLLACNEATINVSSGGHAGVKAMANVTANASSGGSIEVFGHPQVRTLDSSSGGRVTFPVD